MRVDITSWETDTPYGVSVYRDGKLAYRNPDVNIDDLKWILLDPDQQEFRKDIVFLLGMQYLDIMIKSKNEIPFEKYIEIRDKQKYDNFGNRKPGVEPYNFQTYRKTVNDLGEKIK